MTRYSKYTQVAARAVRQALKEPERAKADRRAFQALRYQEWKNGEPSDHVCVDDFRSDSYMTDQPRSC